MTITTTAPQSTVTDGMTTADFADMAATGTWTRTAAPTTGGDVEPAAKPDKPTKTAAKTKTAEPRQASARDMAHLDEAAVFVDHPQNVSYILEAANWCPGDFETVAPATLRELVGEHRARSEAIESGLWRGVHGFYATTVTVAGLSLNVLSWTAARLSVLLNDPRNTQKPASLADTVALHADRAHAMRHTVVKVPYALYAAAATALSLLLNTMSWLAAHAAVALNDPSRLGRVVLAVVFVVVVAGGASAVL